MTDNAVHSICPVCHVGKLRMRKITSTSAFQGQLLVVPNVSALVCDVCGETVIDQEVVRLLSELLESGKPRKHNIPPKRPFH